MQELLPLVFIAVMFVGFYLLVLKPAKKRQAEAQSIVNSVKAGDEIMTTAGIYGEVISVDDDTLVLEVAPGVRLKYAKGAVARILVDEPTAIGEPGTESATGTAVGADAAPGASAVGGAEAPSANLDNPYQRGQS